MSRKGLLLGVWILAAAVSWAGDGAPAAGNGAPEATVKRAVRVCVACHGESGRSSKASIPSLAAQMPIYLATQLKDFRGQTRAEVDVQAYMWGVSALLDDATIDGLAEYFAAQDPSPGKHGRPQLVSAGRQIFEQGNASRGVRACASCHGATAEGASVFPRLAGQNAEYVFRQLQAFRTPLRPHGVLMNNETSALSAQELRAVAEYVQSL